MNRLLYKTPDFEEFYGSLNLRTQKKVDYIFDLIRSERNISTKFVKYLISSGLYEMRISTDNEYRVILFAIDNDNFIHAKEILVLNGFLKKSTADYDKQIMKAIKIMEDFQ